MRMTGDRRQKSEVRRYMDPEELKLLIATVVMIVLYAGLVIDGEIRRRKKERNR
jgi:hypothetical protein